MQWIRTTADVTKTGSRVNARTAASPAYLETDGQQSSTKRGPASTHAQEVSFMAASLPSQGTATANSHSRRDGPFPNLSHSLRGDVVSGPKPAPQPMLLQEGHAETLGALPGVVEQTAETMTSPTVFPDMPTTQNASVMSPGRNSRHSSQIEGRRASTKG
jgi:hypothetical protein